MLDLNKKKSMQIYRTKRMENRLKLLRKNVATKCYARMQNETNAFVPCLAQVKFPQRRASNAKNMIPTHRVPSSDRNVMC